MESFMYRSALGIISVFEIVALVVLINWEFKSNEILSNISRKQKKKSKNKLEGKKLKRKKNEHKVSWKRETEVENVIVKEKEH